ncbi:hypothetical protein ABZ318_15695 [Streptomyces sp. NPDC006197]|uniref:hypothetical protein n=1 Tax=Streptomyces sp. NPDC006197 TaxID=3156685 RepID=UPI00339EE022
MTRTLDALDQAFNGLDGEVDTLQAQMGSFPPKPSPEQTVSGRLDALKGQLGGIPQNPGAGQTVSDRLAKIDAKLVSLSDNIKLNREIFLGYAIAGTVIKVDVQAIKFDLTLLKKIDEKNVWLLKKPIGKLQKGFTALTSKGDGSVFQWTKELISKKAAEERAEREKEKKRKKSHDERLQKHINDLPRKVAINTRDIDRLFGALRSAGRNAQAARDDRTGLPRNHAGVDAKKPAINPVAKDVKNLRSAVDELITSLGSL